MPALLCRRFWLIRGPLTAACAMGVAWAAMRWLSWDWLRNLVVLLCVAVGVGVVLWGLASVAILTRGWFWVPFEGRGRWADVVAREGSNLTMRSSLRWGMDDVVSFDRVDGERLLRAFDQALPAHLPGVSAARPDAGWRAKLEDHADTLLRFVASAGPVPASTREWLPPGTHTFGTHSLRLRFDPATNGRCASVLITSDSACPEVRVDGLYAHLPDLDPDEADEGDDTWPLESLRDTAKLLAAVFGEGRTEPLEAWRIVDLPGGSSWDFYPRPPN